MNDTLELISLVCVTIMGTAAVVGLGAKLVLLPWLRDNLVKPVEETNKQVTVNTHVSEPSTLLDSVHLLEDKMDSMETILHNMAVEYAHMAGSTGVIKAMWDHHLDWSQNEVERLWDAINYNTRHRQSTEKKEEKNYESDH